jgi:hypothetical protein
MRTYYFGERATGVIANPDDWNKNGPRVITPRKRAWGIVIGVFANSRNAVTIQTDANETYCVRVDL